MAARTGTTALLRFDGAVPLDPAIERWFDARAGELGTLGHHWFRQLRRCGPEVRELMHDGCPTVCLGDAGFAYVGIYSAHVNVGFFQAASLADPHGLLEGSGRFMRHVKLRPGRLPDDADLQALIGQAWRHLSALDRTGNR